MDFIRSVLGKFSPFIKPWTSVKEEMNNEPWKYERYGYDEKVIISDYTDCYKLRPTRGILVTESITRKHYYDGSFVDYYINRSKWSGRNEDIGNTDIHNHSHIVDNRRIFGALSECAINGKKTNECVSFRQQLYEEGIKNIKTPDLTKN